MKPQYIVKVDGNRFVSDEKGLHTHPEYPEAVILTSLPKAKALAQVAARRKFALYAEVYANYGLTTEERVYRFGQPCEPTE